MANTNGFNSPWVMSLYSRLRHELFQYCASLVSPSSGQATTQPPKIPTKSARIVNSGSIVAVAISLGFTSFITGSVPSARMASICSVTFIEPSSLAMPDEFRPATINAVSAYGHNAPQKLYLQSMPFIGLSDTSTAAEWVSDSAAGMTAIVTGRKTRNGVISQGPDAVRGKQDGTALKTILEYAEERGLSTAVISNMSMADATVEEVVVAAKGPGAERVRGFMPNTQLFHIMMAAYGWKETPHPAGK